ncbi:MAG: hypothetical protein EOL89_06975 [Actinobacteria bacterium]|nr:hypothetical protein [Actinomycetota bacterium]
MTEVEPGWAPVVIWAVVNGVNLLQGIGFLSRVRTRDIAANHALGFGILALGLPALVALAALLLEGAPVLHWVGAAVLLAFLALMLWVDYLRPVEFRSPRRPGILVPYLLLFFGAILLMGLPMYTLDRGLWLVTVATTVFHLSAMGAAIRSGVG